MADRLLLESGAPDGYQLEDGSGVLLNEQTTHEAAAAITTSGVVAAVGAMVYAAVSAVQAAASVLSNGVVELAAAAAIATSGVTVPAAVADYAGASSIEASAVVGSSGEVTRLGSASVDASGTVAADGSADYAGATAVDAMATVDAAGTVETAGGGTTHEGAASIDAVGAIASAGFMDLSGGALLEAIGTVAASATLLTGGIDQPGACGTVTTFEDDTHTDATLDGDAGTYSIDDIVAKGLTCADVIDLGTSPAKSYRAKCSIQNGDGVGTATTTLKALSCHVLFDSTKTYVMSTVGQANRWTKLGEKVQGAAGKPGGKNGAIFELGGNTIFRGNMLLYGSTIRNMGTNTIQFTPGSTGRSGEIVDCIIETKSGTANVNIGASSGSLQLVSNVVVILGGTGILGTVAADLCERLKVILAGTNPYFINTNVTFAIKEGIFAGTPTTADIKVGAGDGHVVDHTFSGNAPKCDVALSYLNDWVTMHTRTFDPLTGAVVASVPVQVYDKNASLLFDVVSDANGDVAFGAADTIFVNAVKVERAIGSPAVTEEMGPFTVKVNQAGAVLSQYAGYDYKLSAPYVDLPSTYGRQYRPFMLDLPMAAPVEAAGETVVMGGPMLGSLPSDWRSRSRTLQHMVGRARIVAPSMPMEIAPTPELDVRIVPTV